MIKNLLFCALLAFPFYSYGQKSLLNALYNSQEKISTSNIDPQFEKEKNKSGKEKSNVTTSCTSNDQTSLPLRVVLGLLRGKGATLEPSYNTSSNSLSVYGGPMIGNCNSMLEYSWGEPGDGVPYTFEVRIKKPSGCSGATCKYDVQTLKDDRVVELDGGIEVEPTMDGFIKCLEKTGVYSNGKVDKSKIVTTEFSAEKSGISNSSDVWFMSRGPAALNSGGGVFSKKNKKNNTACYFYEDIQKDGFAIYTKEDIKKKNLMDEAQNLCKSKDYEEIYGNLKNYESFTATYRDLEDIMKEQLLKEVEKAKKEFDKAVKKGDLSKLDTEKYARLFKDFYELIIQKQLDEDSHNATDENNMDLLVNLYSAWEDAKTKEEKDQLEKKIRDLQKKLNKYMQKPYFTADDYQYFISMKNKAPLKDPKWKEATITLHKALVSLRLSCQAYSVDSKSCSFSDRSNNMKDMASIEDVNSAIAKYNDVAKVKYEQREYVLKNPDENQSEEFADLIKKCEKLYSEANQKQAYYMQTKGQYNMMAMQQCRNKNPYMGMFGSYGGYYTKKYQQCIEDMNYDYKMKFKVSSSKIEVCDSSIDEYKDEYKKWKDIEDIRDKYYYGDKQDDDDDNNATRNSDGSYNFSYTPGQVQQTNNGYNMAGQYNPYMNYNMGQQQQGTYNPQLYNMYGMNMRNGISGNTGFGLNMGLNTGMGYTGYPYSTYGRYPSTYGYTTGNSYYGMPTAMTNYMGNMSSTGGAYNFTYGGI